MARFAVAVECGIAGRNLLLDFVAAYRFVGVPFGKHRFCLGDLGGDPGGIEFRQVDADGRFVFGSFERALYVAQVGGRQTVHVVALAECPVVPVHQFHRHEEQVVGERFSLHDRKRVDFEFVGVHALFRQFDGLGVAGFGVGRITGQGGTGRDRCGSGDGCGEESDNWAHCRIGLNFFIR